MNDNHGREAQATATNYFVATHGNDAWSGTRADADGAGTDGPFATLERARDAVRQLKAAGPMAKPVNVLVRGGLYQLDLTFKLGEDDSGTAAAPVTYRAYGAEQPVVIGGKRIVGFTPYKGKILQADVASQGLKDVCFRQLLFNGKRQTLARYPKVDPQSAIPNGGGYAYVDGKPKEMYTDYPDDNKRLLQYAEKDARQWAHPEDGQVFIFTRYNWWNNIVPIKSVDAGTRTITLADDASYPIRPTDRYFVQGMLEELDAPGEWYLDRRTWTLFFWPPEPLADATVCAPVLRNIIEMDGCRHVTFRGLTLECCDGNAITLNDCSDCLIAASTIRNVGDYNGNGVVVTGGFRNGVVGNDLYQIGRDGVQITGGDRITLTPGDSYADNNYIHHVGTHYKWGTGVTLTGCGLRATHNLIHDCPRAAIGFGGNNLVMEYNHMRHLCLDSEDAAGIGTGGRDWISSRGSSVSYNYIHDAIGYGRELGYWVSPYFSWGIYLDDNTGGVDVIGNIVYGCGQAGLHLHNARDIRVENNVFVDNTQFQIELSGWTTAHIGWTGNFPTMVKGYESVANQPAWRNMRGMELHPKDAPLSNGLIMAGNTFERNVFARTHRAADLFGVSPTNLYGVKNVDCDHNRWAGNVLWQCGDAIRIEIDRETRPAVDPWTEWRKRGEDLNSIVADPGFVNAGGHDYRLREESPAFALGFQPIPVDKIGPYASELRASWPIVEAEGVREKPLVTPDVARVKELVRNLGDSNDLNKFQIAFLIGSREGREQAARLRALRRFAQATREIGRLTLTLPVVWRFRADPTNAGDAARWFADEPDAAWDEIRTDASWTGQAAGRGYYGPAWYSVAFTAPACAGHCRLFFGAVDGSCRVWLDGRPVGEQDLDPALMWDEPFALELPAGAVTPGRVHRLTVRVEKNSYNAGIWKPVELRNTESA